MEATTVSALTEMLVNFLLGGFSLVCICVAVNMIQSIVNDHKREKREEKKSAQDDEYHAQRMKEFLK